MVRTRQFKSTIIHHNGHDMWTTSCTNGGSTVIMVHRGISDWSRVVSNSLVASCAHRVSNKTIARAGSINPIHMRTGRRSSTSKASGGWLSEPWAHRLLLDIELGTVGLLFERTNRCTIVFGHSSLYTLKMKAITDERRNVGICSSHRENVVFYMHCSYF